MQIALARLEMTSDGGSYPFLDYGDARNVLTEAFGELGRSGEGLLQRNGRLPPRRAIGDFDFVHPFDPPEAPPSRRDEARGEAVLGSERFAANAESQ